MNLLGGTPNTPSEIVASIKTTLDSSDFEFNVTGAETTLATSTGDSKLGETLELLITGDHIKKKAGPPSPGSSGGVTLPEVNYKQALEFISSYAAARNETAMATALTTAAAAMKGGGGKQQSQKNRQQKKNKSRRRR